MAELTMIGNSYIGSPCNTEGTKYVLLYSKVQVVEGADMKYRGGGGGGGYMIEYERGRGRTYKRGRGEGEMKRRVDERSSLKI